MPPHILSPGYLLVWGVGWEGRGHDQVQGLHPRGPAEYKLLVASLPLVPGSSLNLSSLSSIQRCPLVGRAHLLQPGRWASRCCRPGPGNPAFHGNSHPSDSASSVGDTSQTCSPSAQGKRTRLLVAPGGVGKCPDYQSEGSLESCGQERGRGSRWEGHGGHVFMSPPAARHPGARTDRGW